MKDMSLTFITRSHMTSVKVDISLTLARRETAALVFVPPPWPPLFVSPCFTWWCLVRNETL